MKKSSSEMLHFDSYGMNKKKRRKIRLSQSLTEQWMGLEDADALFTTSLLSAAAADVTGEESPAHVSSFRARSLLPKDKHEERKKLLNKNRHSSISLKSFSELFGSAAAASVREEREGPEMGVSEVAGAVIHPGKVTSMSSSSRMEALVKRLMLFSRSGNESLPPQDVQKQREAAIDETPILVPQHRRLIPVRESSVPLHERQRRLSLSSEGNEKQEEDERSGMITTTTTTTKRTGGKYHSSSSLCSLRHKQHSYSFDDIDRLIQMTPQRRKIEKNKKSSRQRGGDHQTDAEKKEKNEEQKEGMDRLLLHHHESDSCSSCAAADASADKPELNQDYFAISRRRMRGSRKGEDRCCIQKCNSNFEMGSFCGNTAANRKRVAARRSALFPDQGFAFLEEDEQSGSFSGQLPHSGSGEAAVHSVAVMSRKMQQREEVSQHQGTEDQRRGDKSSHISAPRDSHTICSKSLPGSEHHHHDADDVPQLSVTPGERLSTTSGDPLSMTCNTAQRFCRLCLEELPDSDFQQIASCGCSFCRPCLSLYLTIRIQENLNISSLSCPDSGCPAAATAIHNLITSNNKQINRKKNLKFRLMRGCGSLLRKSKSFVLQDESSSKSSSKSLPHQMGERVPNLITKQEIERLVDLKTLHLYQKHLVEAEVHSDPCKTFCPAPDCDNICLIVRPSSAVMSVSSTISSLSSVSPAAATSVLMSANKLQRSAGSSSKMIPNSAIYCSKCDKRFCLSCRQDYHPGQACDSSESADMLQKQHLISSTDNVTEEMTDIKRCPRCSVWIERDEGCAQMMCRKCRHVFCWFCLQSLEDDFLLRHYDRGPCKNKLGHSRASVVWHRTQVVGIFAGFGVLLLLISPLFLMAAPCLLCCNCFTCSSCQQSPADLLTPSSSFSSSTASSSDRKLRNLLY